MATNAYSPYAPTVLGETWAPITNTGYEPSLFEERGYWFNLGASATPITARVYVDRPSNAPNVLTVPSISIYEAGREDQGGPIQEVIIPCSGTASSGTVSPTTQAAQVSDLYLPNDEGNVLVTNGSLNCYFATNAFSQLSGKRIVDVSFLYIMYYAVGAAGTADEFPPDVNLFSLQFSDTMPLDTPQSMGTSTTIAPALGTVPSLPMGEYNPFYGTRTTYSDNPSDIFPWDYAALQRYEPGTTTNQRVAVQVRRLGTGTSFQLYYAALRVRYCNETRVAVGGRRSESAYTPNQGWGPEGTAFSIPVVQPTDYTAAPVLTAKDYTVFVSSAKIGDPAYNRADMPEIGAFYQLYELAEPGIHGLNVDKLTTPGDVRIAEHTSHIPAISLHTSSGTVADSHGYNQELIAPVYAVEARQGIVNAALTAGTRYNMARFFARRLPGAYAPLRLYDTAATTASAYVSPEEFDALPEIANGWKQVDVTFDTPPTFTTSGNSTFAFASGAGGNGTQWQVLGARARSVTGLSVTEIGPPNWLATTTYGGGSAQAVWDQGSGTATADPRGDLILMFANVPQVTGLTISSASLPVTANIDCVLNPEAIPTSIDYHELTWASGALGVADIFNRTASNGWGTANSGSAWSVVTGTASDFAVNGLAGTITHTASITDHMILAGAAAIGPNQSVKARFAVSADTVGVSQGQAGIVLRALNGGNYYHLKTVLSEPYTQVQLDRYVGGSGTNLAIGYGPRLGSAGTYMWLKAEIVGTSLRAKIWLDGTDEPGAWLLNVVDSSLTAAGFVGVLTSTTGGSHPYTFSVKDFSATMVGFGGLELQRRDAYSDWQTIMLATNFATSTFADFEARVGLESEYRIRACHELDFCGPWSDTVVETIPEPGVDGVNVDSSVLIFTTNSFQDGSGSLAHVAVWDSTPSETFTFLEATDSAFQPMYDRDMRVYFHGTERGGQTFQRTLLMNNAAVGLMNYEALFSGLRDLAWDSVPNICVRDEHGSRWFAAIQVPDGAVQPPDKTGQYAPVAITEVASIPAPVDPDPS